MRHANCFRALLMAIVLLAGAQAGAQTGQRCVLMVDRFQDPAELPQFNPVFDQGILAEELLQFDIDTSSPSDQTGLYFTLLKAPADMSIDSATGVVTWTPGALQVGTIAATVAVVDPQGRRNRHTFCIQVVDGSGAPLIAPLADQTALVDTSFSLPIEASDPDPGDTLTYTLDQAPEGMTIDPQDGLIDWMPAALDLGLNTVVVRVSDSTGRADTAVFEITVADENQPPVIQPLTDRGARPGAVMTIQVVASDPDSVELIYGLTERPPGMTIDETDGLISWSPTLQQLGTHNVEVRVADSLGYADQTGFQVFVDRNRAPSAVDDAGFRVERGDTLTVPADGVLANDTDPNDDLLSAQRVSGPQRGTLMLDADGGFQYTPDNPGGTIALSEKWRFLDAGGIIDSAPQPLIANLDDDPAAEIFIVDNSGCCTRYLTAIDGETGTVDWERVFTGRQLSINARPAIGDIDLDGKPEIIVIGGETDAAVTLYTKLYAFEHDGHIKWISESLGERLFPVGSSSATSEGEMDSAAITLADLDGDGTPELLVAPGAGTTVNARVQVWDNQGRKLERYSEPGTSMGRETRTTVVDLDLDGDPEIVVGNVAWSHDGELLWARKDNFTNFQMLAFPVVANLDDDPYPELVRTRGGNSFPDDRGNVVAWNHDGTDLWEVARPNGFNKAPMSVADVDGDGFADVLQPWRSDSDQFDVLDGRDGSVKWSKSVTTRTIGATTIDMDRDGFVEVLFVDESGQLHVWDGRDGTEKGLFDLSVARPSDQTVPVFTDIDADGVAELVVPGGSNRGSTAVSVWESPADDWPPMRSVWNQQRYHVTNINDDLTIPARERPHWLQPGLNQAMVNGRLPEARIEEHDAFTYRASDGEFDSNIATVDITILPPNAPPRIVSTPRALASPGFEYSYAALAVDADAGETLVWSLAEAPPGMTVDAVGTVRWTPVSGDIGGHPVVVEVTDSLGVSGFQHFVIDVVPPVIVPDLTGFDEVAAVGALEAVTLIADPLREVFSNSVAVGEVAGQEPAGGTTAPAGGSVAVDISLGPVPVQVPRLQGLRELEAIDALLAAGLSVGTIVYANNDVVPAGAVVEHEPTPLSLVAPGSPVDLRVSGGPRALISLDPVVIPAGSASTVTVSVRDIDGTPLDPQPAVTLSLNVPAGDVAGAAPTLGGSLIQTDSESQGTFEVVASFDSETVITEAVIFQPPSDGGGADIYTEFAGQLDEFNRLIVRLIEAVEAGDSATIEQVDVALGNLLEAVDTARLRSISPIAPDGGVPPSPQAAADAGFGPGPDDSAYADVSADLLGLLVQLEQVVGEGTAPDAVIAALNQELGATAASLAELQPDVYGVLEARGSLIAILGTRVPRMLETDIRAVRQALRDAGIITDAGVSAAGRFSLPGIMSASAIRQSIVNDFYVPYLGDVARAMGTIIAADLLEAYVNGGAIVGVTTGGSLALHVFDIPNSVIEGFGFDPADPANNQVTIVGPQLIDTVMDTLGDLPGAEDFKDLNSIMDTVQTQIKNADAVGSAWREANSVPTEVLQGCILDGFPTCRQLVYAGGIASVYKVDSGLSLPAPAAVIVRNLDGGGMAVFVANFLPTREE